MKISFDTEKEDLVAFHAYHYDSDPKVRRQVRRSIAIVVMLFLIAGAYLSYKSGWNWIPLAFFAVSGLLWALFFPRYNRRRWLGVAEDATNDPTNSNWFEHNTMEADDDRVRFISDTGEQTLRWDFFIREGETDNHFFLYVAKNQAVTIPKRNLSPSETDELRSLFAKHIAVNISETKNKK